MANKGLAHKEKAKKFRAKHPEGRKKFAREKTLNKMQASKARRARKVARRIVHA